ncbi:MAG: hypothetical protein LBS35_03150, partial [Synergistaceae bacterium]|nr:hypothetical protein [Synergistaceae bacterium]
IMPVQTKSNFHPLGEKPESRETRNKGYPQGFQLINLWIWVCFGRFSRLGGMCYNKMNNVLKKGKW